MWEPRTTHAYHAITYGWLVGEVVLRISGKSLGTFFADEVAGPLGLDFRIGLPASKESRVSRIIEVDLEDPGIERIGERAREMLEAATAPKSYLMQNRPRRRSMWAPASSAPQNYPRERRHGCAVPKRLLVPRE